MKKLLSVYLAICMALSLCAFATAEESPYAGGTGTEADPYRIATAEQLQALSNAVNDSSAGGYPGTFFVLTADIDLKDIAWQPIGHMDLADMSNYSCMFMGTLDGQGHTVSNVYFRSDYPVCGVGVVGMSLGEVKNLTVKNVDIRLLIVIHRESFEITGLLTVHKGKSVSVLINRHVEFHIGIVFAERRHIRDPFPCKTQILQLRQRFFTVSGIIHVFQAEKFDHIFDHFRVSIYRECGRQPVGIGTLVVFGQIIHVAAVAEF